ncbi:MAG: DUF3365 domain-containing protein [Cyanobacteria bacterium P01_F01_bin.116]
MVRNLGPKFSLLLALVWLLGGGATLFMLSQHLNAQAEQTMSERAEIVLTAMQAARDYTQHNIQPLVNTYAKAQTTDDSQFVQEIIPNFAARSIFANFREQDPGFQDYLYKEAAVNPTNPTDRADDFEAALFPQLQPLTEDPPEKISGYRKLNDQNLFYLARPLVMKDTSCLACHGQAQDAPLALIKTYGDRNGFGWQLNEVVATQLMYVPADMIFARGQQNLFTVAKTFLAIFGSLFILINLLLWRNVIRPLGVLTKTAKHIGGCPISPSQEKLEADAALTLLMHRRDEPGQLARAFQYMLHVLGQREQDLQQAVAERTQSLEQEMRDRKTAQDTLRTYSRAMNHDLRNLVVGISNVVQATIFCSARQDANKAQNAANQLESIPVDSKALTMIQQSCDRQLNLMNSLTEVQSSDIWSLSLQKDQVNLQQLTEDLRFFYETKQTLAAITINNQISSELPLIYGDLCQLKRVFENLIDNALKYNPQGVTITLTARVWDPTPSMIQCAVIDDGVGIEPAKSQELFEIYTRGDNHYSVSGYGLGLYICRKIIESHGGQIGVKTAANQGAEFWFTLPIVGTA